MLTADELIRQAEEYIAERASVQEFADWVEENADAYDNLATRGIYVAIEGALSGYFFDHIGQPALRRELAVAIRPFVEASDKESRFVPVEMLARHFRPSEPWEELTNRGGFAAAVWRTFAATPYQELSYPI